MKLKDQILELLENNKTIYLSGENIASQLCVTRAAVWKAIKSLQKEGYQIDAVTNKGYCLSAQTDILSAASIKKYLNASIPLNFNVMKSVTSTNSVLKELANAGEAEGTVLVATEQTEGRGRMGRSFYSPTDTGVYFSILLKPNLDARQATTLTTLAAVAVCNAIEKVSKQTAKIKWVNDVFVNDKKVCGILTEASVSMENGRIDYVILGIGLNVYEPKEGFPSDIQEIAGSIFKKKENEVMNQLIAEFFNCFYSYYNNFEKKDFVQEYKKRSMVIGRPITVISKKGSRIATALDIDDNCGLRVLYKDNTEEILTAGEISIRI